MSDTHSFRVDVATEVGVNAAILLGNIKWWCEKNRANNRHYHEGLWWTYNTNEAMRVLFPYMGKSAIASALKKLETAGYIRVGNYNKTSYDRTKWYALTEYGWSIFGESISGNRKMEGTESGNGTGENGQPIPVIDQLSSSSSSSNKDDEIPFKEIVDYLNEVAGKRFKATNQETRKHIRARWNEGFTLDDFKTVIDVKSAQWLRDPKMSSFLRPETLFGTKFESYLNESATRGGRSDSSMYSLRRRDAKC